MEYRYTAVDGTGQERTGKVSADAPGLASAKLKEQGLFPVALSTESGNPVSDNRRCRVRRRPIARLLGGSTFRQWLRAVGEGLDRGHSKTLFDAARSVKAQRRPFLIGSAVDTVEDGLFEGEALWRLAACTGLLAQEDVDRIAGAEEDGGIVRVLMELSKRPPPGRVSGSGGDPGGEPAVSIVQSDRPIHRVVALILAGAVERDVDRLEFVRDESGVPKMRTMRGAEPVDMETPPTYLMDLIRRVLMNLACVPYWSRTEVRGRIRAWNHLSQSSATQ